MSHAQVTLVMQCADDVRTRNPAQNGNFAGLAIIATELRCRSPTHGPLVCPQAWSGRIPAFHSCWTELADCGPNIAVQPSDSTTAGKWPLSEADDAAATEGRSVVLENRHRAGSAGRGNTAGAEPSVRRRDAASMSGTVMTAASILAVRRR
jgi:hypothetical protein